MIAIDEVPKFHQGYVKSLGSGDLIPMLLKTGDAFIDFGRKLTEAQGNYRYAEGKWSIKELIQHVIDTERVFIYRAMRFARKDQTPLAGFEQDDYVSFSDADKRSIHSLMNEFANLRASTIDLFTSFTPDMRSHKGISNGVEISVEAIGYIISGHLNHHLNTIYERYTQ